ncbi:hypothetical protein CB1_000350039 [Camelus ferus]|nr:hypothetical protein CB1_000350039 [Camelus ferus]
MTRQPSAVARQPGALRARPARSSAVIVQLFRGELQRQPRASVHRDLISCKLPTDGKSTCESAGTSMLRLPAAGAVRVTHGSAAVTGSEHAVLHEGQYVQVLIVPVSVLVGELHQGPAAASGFHRGRVTLQVRMRESENQAGVWLRGAGRLSGFQLPSSIVSTGSVLTLWFTTDFAVSAQGFRALYEVNFGVPSWRMKHRGPKGKQFALFVLRLSEDRHACYGTGDENIRQYSEC